MRPGESFVGQPVRSLQTMLQAIARAAQKPCSVVPDGIYGRQTMNAVSTFQQEHGLPVTGVVNQQTWERIVSEYGPSACCLAPAQPLQIILNPNQVLRHGEENPCVFLVQSMLLQLHRVYSSISEPSVNGIMDTPTCEALASMQYLCGLPQTGELNKITWKHLVLQYPLSTNLHSRSCDTA